MSECHRLSDRMPAVALGATEWRPDDAQHLSTCRCCQEEWDLVRSSSRLGRKEGLQLDPTSTSRILLEQVERARRGRRRRAWSFGGLAAAATIVAVVWSGPTARRPAATVAGLQISLPELDSLQPAELESVLQTMDEPAPADSTLDELANFLDSWEG